MDIISNVGEDVYLETLLAQHTNLKWRRNVPGCTPNARPDPPTNCATAYNFFFPLYSPSTTATIFAVELHEKKKRRKKFLFPREDATVCVVR